MKRLVALTICSSLLIACTADKSSRTKHEGPLPQVQEPLLRAGSTQPQALQSVYARRFEIATRIDSKDSKLDAIQAILNELSPYILKVDYIESPSHRRSRELVSALTLFNKALLKALELDAKGTLAGGHLDQYLKVALNNCTQELKNCVYLDFFAQDHNSARIFLATAQSFGTAVDQTKLELGKVAKAIADARPHCSSGGLGASADSSCTSVLRLLEERYASQTRALFLYLRAAYELKNSQYSDELDLLYVRYSKDMFALLRSNSEQDRKTMRIHRDVLNTALMQIRSQAESGSKSRKEYCDFIIQTNPINFSLKDAEHLDSRGLKTYVSEFIKCSDQRQQLSKIIRSQIDEEQKLQTAEAVQHIKENAAPTFEDKGYAFALELVADTPSMMNGLGVERIQRNDLVHFVIDRVFYEQIDHSVALEYWSKLRQTDDAAIINYARNYIRVQVAYVLKSTLTSFASFFQQQIEARGGLGADIFSDITTYMNSKVQFEWELLKIRTRLVKDFLVLVYDTKYKNGNPTAKICDTACNYVALKDQLESLSQHVNFLAVAPMTLAMSYYMAKSQGNIKFFVPWWPSETVGGQWFDIKADDALLTFFNSDRYLSRPLFRFGDVTFKMSELQKLISLDLAMRSGLFELFPFYLYEPDRPQFVFTDKQLNRNNEILFFKQFIKDYLKGDDKAMTQQIQDLENLKNNQDFRDKFSALCRDPLNASIQLDIDQLYSTTLLPDGYNDVADLINRIYNNMGSLNMFRSNYEFSMSVLSLIEKHVTGQGAELRLPKEKFEVRQQIAQSLRGELERFLSLERNLLRRIFALDRQVVNDKVNCLRRIYEADWIRREAIIDEHIRYYLDIHAAMSLLAATNHLEDQTNIQQLRLATETYLQAIRFNDRDDRQATANSPKVQALRQRIQGLLQQLEKNQLLKDLEISRSSKRVLEEALNLMLNIHNFDVSPFGPEAGKKSADYGFFLKGTPTYSATGIAIKRLNSISSEQFVQARWDSIARIRYMLQTLTINPEDYQLQERLGLDYGAGPIAIGRAVHIPLGTTFAALEEMGIYKENKVDRVYFDTDPDKFLKAAMIQLIGLKTNGNMLLAWMSPSGDVTQRLRRRLRYLLDLYNRGSIETTDADTKNCAYDEWNDVVAPTSYSGKRIAWAEQKSATCRAIRVTGEEIVNEYLDILSLYHIPPKMRDILTLVDRPTIYENATRKFLAYRNEPSTESWTYFDEFFRTNFTTVEGHMADGTPVQVETFRGRSQFKDLREGLVRDVVRSRHLFDLGDNAVQVLRDRTRRTFLRHLGQIREIEESIADLEFKKVQLAPVVFERVTPNSQRPDERYLPGGWRTLPVKVRADGTPIYLRDQNSAKSWFYSFIETYFVNETGCEALTTEADPDGKKYPELIISTAGGSCTARYQQWQRAREKEQLRIREIRRQGN